MTASTGSQQRLTAALFVGLTGILGSACTPNPPPSPPTAPSSPNGRSTAAGGPEQSAVATGSEMTPVPQSSLCASTVVLAFAVDRLVTGLRAAGATCVGWRPGRPGGTSGLVGSVLSPDSPSST